MEKGIGLILAGGGGKGAYQIGVWKALRELGVEQNITAVAGTSVGALNAALFAAGKYEDAEEIWKNITPAQILSPHTLKEKLERKFGEMMNEDIDSETVSKALKKAVESVSDMAKYSIPIAGGILRIIKEGAFSTSPAIKKY